MSEQRTPIVVVTDRRGLEERRPGQAACVLVDPDDAELLAALRGAVPDPHLTHMAVGSRRPLVHVDPEHIAVVAFLADGWDDRRRIFLVASGDLLVVVGDAFVRDLARQAVAPAHDAAGALAKTLAAVARSAEADLDRLGDAEAETLSLDGTRLISGHVRREVSRRRARLFEWRQIFAAHARLLDDDEALAEALDEDVRWLLRPARASFQYSADVADRLYAVLGDVLSQQDALASQRLTLVSTVFLPLTVTTGFFGMNFGWLTNNIGSLSTFVVFGVVVPVLSVLLSLAFVRRYGV